MFMNLKWRLAFMTLLLFTLPAAAQDAPLVEAAKKGDVATVNALLKLDATTTAPGGAGEKALLWVASQGHVDVVKSLLAAKVNAKDGETALFHAVDVGSTATVKALLARGADVNIRTTRGQTAIDRARAPQKKEIRTLLEKAGAK